VLRSWFADWTVLAIAHKLDSVLDFDMVAVLDDGHLVEFGQPRELLARDDSKFRILYEHTKNEVTFKGDDSAGPS
jgi:ATP-binding cassette, subfamily C (CFTR/MRP), member 1